MLAFGASTIFLFGIPSSIAAQTPTVSNQLKTTQSWTCLAASLQNSVETNTVQTIQLSGKCVSQNNECYIATCFTTATGSRCTTGNDAYDAELHWGKNNYSQLKKIDSMFTYEVKDGAKIKTTDGNLNMSVTTSSKDFILWTFHSIGTNPITDNARGNMGYAPFGFAGDTSCTPFHIDPFGIVFDSQSLEPLPNISITLLDQNKAPLKMAGVSNPVKTAADGVFNFVLPTGNFYLSPIPRSGYSFNQTFIHPNYTKSFGNLYKADEVIIATTGNPVHYDIALNPGVNPAFHADPVNINYSMLQLGNQFKIVGKQSHPLTVVSFKQNEIEIAKTTANRFGYYELSIQNSTIHPDQMIEVYLTKIDLTKNEQINNPTKSISIEPQPPYLEGLAVTKKGAPLPNATVSIKLNTSDDIYYQTIANEDGLFVVPPQFIPVLPYYLEFTPTRSTIVTKLSSLEFASLNKDYLATNKIDLTAMTKNDKPITIQNNPPINLNSKTNRPTTNLPLDNSNGLPIKSNNMALIVGLVLFFIIFVFGSLFYIYLKQKSKTPVDTLSKGSSANNLT